MLSKPGQDIEVLGGVRRQSFWRGIKSRECRVQILPPGAQFAATAPPVTNASLSVNSVPVKVTVDPPEAAIFMDGAKVGTGSFEKVLDFKILKLKPFFQIIIVRIWYIEEFDPTIAHFRDRRNDVVGSNSDMLTPGSFVEFDVLFNL